ncbi:MAG: alcohol dehydrogenase catalytic domain-containing protein [Desulfobacteraceae bacterium]|nr:alcohol dehydrogenase catalytic domain-containing protein [Desulfobacteraceae bacterium]
MKAVKLTSPKQLELADVETPVADGENVIIEVSACGICGSDLHYWHAGRGMGGVSGLIMGHEFSGVVVDPGNRGDLAKGDRVTALPLDPCGFFSFPRSCVGMHTDLEKIRYFECRSGWGQIDLF